MSVQPKEGGGGGGETRESIVYQLADDMLRKLPPKYVSFEVREALNRLGALLPMNIFFRYAIYFVDSNFLTATELHPMQSSEYFINLIIQFIDTCALCMCMDSIDTITEGKSSTECKK